MSRRLVLSLGCIGAYCCCLASVMVYGSADLRTLRSDEAWHVYGGQVTVQNKCCSVNPHCEGQVYTCVEYDEGTCDQSYDFTNFAGNTKACLTDSPGENCTESSESHKCAESRQCVWDPDANDGQGECKVKGTQFGTSHNTNSCSPDC